MIFRYLKRTFIYKEIDVVRRKASDEDEDKIRDKELRRIALNKIRKIFYILMLALTNRGCFHKISKQQHRVQQTFSFFVYIKIREKIKM